MASPGNWMHLQYQSRLQARKALSKDGKVFGDVFRIYWKQMYNIVFYLKVLIILILPFLTTPGKVAKLDFE